MHHAVERQNLELPLEADAADLLVSTGASPAVSI